MGGGGGGGGKDGKLVVKVVPGGGEGPDLRMWRRSPKGTRGEIGLASRGAWRRRRRARGGT
jgi:hypothetical protein